MFVIGLAQCFIFSKYLTHIAALANTKNYFMLYILSTANKIIHRPEISKSLPYALPVGKFPWLYGEMVKVYDAVSPYHKAEFIQHTGLLF